MEPINFNRPQRTPDIEAEIYALKTEEGGRKSPLISGYRPSHNFELDGMLNDAMHEYPDKGIIKLGEKGKAYLWFLCPDYQIGRLYKGMKFTVQEGNKIIGKGVVTEIVNKELEKK